MDLKKKVSEVKAKIKQHPNCIAVVTGMLISAAACGYYSGKELSEANKHANAFNSFLSDIDDGEKHAVWLDYENRKLYAETRPLSEEDL